MDEITIGTYTIPVILMVVLGVIYKIFTSIPDRWKALIAICVGIVIGIVAMFYNVAVAVIGIKIVINYVLLGLMAGAAAVGLYEGVWKTSASPRE